MHKQLWVNIIVLEKQFCWKKSLIGKNFLLQNFFVGKSFQWKHVLSEEKSLLANCLCWKKVFCHIKLIRRNVIIFVEKTFDDKS